MSEVTVTVSGPIGSGKSAIAGEIEIAMRAIGIKVRYADPSGAESEKRLTHADWQQAIEDCNPSVVIVEAAPSPAPSGWLPIESAPKDGSTVLAILEDSQDTGMVYTIEWRDEMAKEEIKDGKGIGWRHSWDSYFFSGFDAPTHWQPLPAPPEKDTKP